MGRDFIYCVVFYLVIGMLSFSFQENKYLQLEDAQGQVLLIKSLDSDEEFGIRFKHSVALSPVEEWFKANGSDIALLRTIYQDFGAGLPHEPDVGQTMSFGNGKIEISGYKLKMSKMPVRVGRIARHVLLLPQENDIKKELSLDKLVNPGEAIVFSIKNLNRISVLWQYWYVIY